MVYYNPAVGDRSAWVVGGLSIQLIHEIGLFLRHTTRDAQRPQAVPRLAAVGRAAIEVTALRCPDERRGDPAADEGIVYDLIPLVAIGFAGIVRRRFTEHPGGHGAI